MTQEVARFHFPCSVHFGSQLHNDFSTVIPFAIGAGLAEIGLALASLASNFSILRCSAGRGWLLIFMRLFSHRDHRIAIAVSTRFDVTVEFRRRYSLTIGYAPARFSVFP